VIVFIIADINRIYVGVRVYCSTKKCRRSFALLVGRFQSRFFLHIVFDHISSLHVLCLDWCSMFQMCFIQSLLVLHLYPATVTSQPQFRFHDHTNPRDLGPPYQPLFVTASCSAAFRRHLFKTHYSRSALPPPSDSAANVP